MERKACLAFVFVTLLAGNLPAQQSQPMSPFMVKVDYGRFSLDDSTVYLEVYYSFYPRQLMFERKNDRLRGDVQLTTQLRNKKTGAMLINKQSLIPVDVADTLGQTLPQTIVTQGGYAVPVGEYEMTVVACDSLRKDRRDSVNFQLNAVAFGQDMTASDIMLCSNITNSQNKSDLFYKNTLEVIPNPSLVFGVTTHPVVFHYVELYNLSPEVTYTVKTEVIDGTGKAVRTSSKERKYGIPKAVEVGMVNVGSIPSGRYSFRITVLDDAQKVKTQPRRTFFVYNPHVKPPEVARIQIEGSEFLAMGAEELADEWRKAQYIASGKDGTEFSKISSVEGQRTFLTNFWKDIEIGRTGRAPISRADYLRRVTVSNQRYTVFTKEGWRSDQGRVFILYGEPDEVERYPSSESTRPYEIWHYYQIENGVIFVFIDRTGFRSYDLVHSTKRGEPYDDQWQRQLQ